MIDRDLEFKVKRLKEFMQLWIKFHDLYKDALSRETITPEEEKNFLETKSLIARKYQALKDLLGIGSSYEYKSFDVISQVLSLKSVAAISDLSMHKIENDWHSSYIMLNRMLGELEGKQEALRKINLMGHALRRLSTNPLANLALVIIILLAIYLLINYVQEAYRGQEKIEGKIEFREEVKQKESE